MIGNVNVPGALAADIATVSSVANEALSKANQALETSAGSKLTITFANDFIGKTYTVTDGSNETYTGTVPNDRTVVHYLRQPSITYNVSAAVDGVTYSNTVVADTYFKPLSVSLTVFTATITVTAAPSAEVSATSGAQTYTATANSSGVATVTVKKSGTYTVTATKNGASSSTVSTTVTTDGSTTTATVLFRTITLTSPSGSSVTISKTGESNINGTSTGTDVFYIPSTGTWTVSISKSGDTTSDTVSVSSYTNYPLELSFVHIYGVQWDGSLSTTWTRTDEAASFTDPVPYISGASSYSSPFDNLYPWKDMVKSERTGGTMVAIPKFWYKISSYSNGMKIQIATKSQSGYSVSPAHMNRGDGAGERDVVYVGRYHCGATAYKSASGQAPKASVTRAKFRTNIHNLGNKIWQWDWATRFTIWLLYLVEFANWNSQAKIGYGCSTSGSIMTMGYTDSMPYHTGTTVSSRTTYGGTQYRNIEGLWDNVYDWIDGCYYNSNGMNVILNPSSFSDSTGGTLIGKPSSGYPSKFTIQSSVYPSFYPSTSSSGSSSTYSCDFWGFNASSPCLCVGGNYDQSENRGLFFVSYYTASYSSAYHGSRLMELP